MRVIPGIWLDVYTAVGQISVCNSRHLTGCIEHTSSGVVVLISECHASTDLYYLVDNMVNIEATVVAVHGVALLETLVEHGGK